MISFNIQPTKLEHDHGDYFIGHYDHMIKAYKLANIPQFKQFNMLKLAYIDINPWTALNHLAQQWKVFDCNSIKSLQDSCRYICPYTNNTHFALLPLAILTQDADAYFPKEHRKTWYYEMATDRTWNCKEDGSHLLPENWHVENDTILRCILGPGYTSMTLTNDGSPSLEAVSLDLSNGDTMLAITQVWHNK